MRVFSFLLLKLTPSFLRLSLVFFSFFVYYCRMYLIVFLCHSLSFSHHKNVVCVYVCFSSVGLFGLSEWVNAFFYGQPVSVICSSLSVNCMFMWRIESESFRWEWRKWETLIPKIVPNLGKNIKQWNSLNMFQRHKGK